MNIEESLALYQKGREAWNVWAEQMLTQRNKLIKSGQWSVEWKTYDDLSVWIGTNAVTQDWSAAATCDLSAHTFLDTVDFSSFVFPGDANFTEAGFARRAQFQKAIFGGRALFKRATFNRVEFEDATFNDEADFEEAEFCGQAGFQGATFGRPARFNDATFTDDVKFEKAKFGDNAWFSYATFGVNAGFEEVLFEGLALFMNATFSGGFSEFRGATFIGRAEFGNAAFYYPKFEEVSFGARAGFEEVTFLAGAEFRQAKFAGYAGFRDATFIGAALFGQSIFEGYTNFFRTTFKSDGSFTAIKGLSAFILREATFLVVPDFDQAHFAEAPRLEDIYLRASGHEPDITARWRALKRLAIQGHDHERELDFLAEEIKSLRGVQDWPLPNPLILRKGEPLCWPGGGRYWAGVFYQYFSDFGRSAWRPFLWWVMITSAFTFYFHHLSHHSDLDLDKSLSTPSCYGSTPMTTALYLSINNGLVFSGLGRTEKLAQSYACLYGKEEKDQLFPIIPDAVVFAGLAQTILSAVLIFLFLLALRNYFRIK